MRRSIIGLTVAASGLAASLALAGGSIAPRDAILRSDTDRTRTEVGTHCVSSEPAEDGTGYTMCADAAPPTEPPRPRLDVRPGETIRLRLPDNPNAQDEPTRVGADLARVTNDSVAYVGGGVAVSGGNAGAPRRFELTLPDDLRRANALDVFVRYRAGGDANYLAGLRPRG